mmetsp:Transcript_6584/g.12444  ORF Transcript_6584/g.12444 Transcript_6584/m.12444 type:complete len:272 (+) Transcript_6584:54-869(+)
MPVPFKDFGKSCSDLLSKGFDFKNQVKVVHKTDGVSVETTGTKGKSLDGSFKISNKFDGMDVEFNVSTSGPPDAANIKISKSGLIPDTKLTFNGTAALTGNVEANYSKGDIQSSVKVDCGMGVNAAFAYALDSYTFGGALAGSADGGLKKWDLGMQYVNGSLTKTLSTNGSDLSCSVFNKVSDSFSLGSKWKLGDSRSFTIGSSYNLNKNTSIKNSVDSNGILNCAVSHVFNDFGNFGFAPFKVNVASEFDAFSGNLKANKTGFVFSLGDF